MARRDSSGAGTACRSGTRGAPLGTSSDAEGVLFSEENGDDEMDGQEVTVEDARSVAEDGDAEADADADAESEGAGAGDNARE